MSRCPDCGAENTDAARLCMRCGVNLSPAGTSKLYVPGARYEILSTIKSGAMGCVYRARDTRLGSIVALKKMKSSYSDPEEIRYAAERFRSEAALLSRLDHSGLPKVTDFFTEADPDGDRPACYLVMTFIDGSDIEALIEGGKGLPFAVDEVLSFARQIVQILSYLHSQGPPVIYRDLNPRNIMVSHGKIFLVDFGIARLFDPEQKGTAIGTPGYTAPEQYKGSAEPRSDIYSLGAVMHYLLTGINPEGRSQALFSFSAIRRLNADVPEYLERLIASMVDVVPERRPRSAAEVERLLDGGRSAGASLSAQASARPDDIFEAARTGDGQAIRDFIKTGADINGLDGNGLAPLHIAALQGHKEAVRTLILEGADINVQTPLGHTPVRYAREKGHHGIAGLLCAHGVREKAGSTGDRRAASSTAVRPGRSRLGRVFALSISMILAAILIYGAVIQYGSQKSVHLGSPMQGLMQQGDQKRFQLLLDKARSAGRVEDYDIAADFADAARRIFPNDRTARELVALYALSAAKSHFANMDYAACRESLQRLFSVEPGNSEGKELDEQLNRKMKVVECLSKGDQFMELRDYPKALREYRQAMMLDQDNVTARKSIDAAEGGERFMALIRYAEEALEENDFDSSLKRIDEALKIFPDDEKAKDLRTKIRIAEASRLLECGECKKAFDMALLVTSDSSSAEALDILGKARSAWIDENLVDGKRLLKMNKLDLARRHFKTVLDLETGNLEVQKSIDEIDYKMGLLTANWEDGKAFCRSRDYEKAIRCFETALNLDGDNEEIKKALSEAYLKREEELRAKRLQSGSGVQSKRSPAEKGR